MNDGKNKKNKSVNKNLQPNSSKSILRNPSQQENSPKRNYQPPPDGKKSIKWDEMNVVATLHPVGKDYGHMKIDEAPTPYERPDKGVDAKELTKKLEESMKKGVKRHESVSSDYDEGESTEHSRRESFIKKRQEHYSEYSKAKEFCKKHNLEDEDDD